MVETFDPWIQYQRYRVQPSNNFTIIEILHFLRKKRPSIFFQLLTASMDLEVFELHPGVEHFGVFSGSPISTKFKPDSATILL